MTANILLNTSVSLQRFICCKHFLLETCHEREMWHKTWPWTITECDKTAWTKPSTSLAHLLLLTVAAYPQTSIYFLLLPLSCFSYFLLPDAEFLVCKLCKSLCWGGLLPLLYQHTVQLKPPSTSPKGGRWFVIGPSSDFQPILPLISAGYLFLTCIFSG